MDHSCRYPWTWVVINLDRNQWYFCCKTAWQEDFLSGYNQQNHFLQSVKTKFMEGKKPSACQACWRDEELGGASFRTTNAGAIDRESLSSLNGFTYIDVLIGDLCNLFCATCGAYSSTRWQGILKANNMPFKITKASDDVKEKIIERIAELIYDNASTLTNINILGGEPSIDPFFIKFMESISMINVANLGSRRKPLISIITNGMWPHDNIGQKFLKTVLAVSAKGWDVRLKISVDAIGENAEYIRGGKNWTLFEKNLDDVVSAGIATDFAITTSLFNLPVQGEIMEFAISNPRYSKISPTRNLATTPHKISVSNLGSTIAKFLPKMDHLPDHPNWRSYRYWIKNLASVQSAGTADMKKLEEFRTHTKWYSSVTGIPIPSTLDAIYESYLNPNNIV